MSGETIRDVVIRVAIEQKAANLKVPEFSKSVSSGVNDLSKQMAAVDKAIAKTEADAERSFDKQAQEAVSAYSRIMRAREQDAAAAERLYDKEANDAVSAYSRIMRAREEAAAKQNQLNQSIQSQHSAIMSTYASGAAAAMQLARGIAFVTAANEEEAASMLKALAAAQGYFDLGIGTIQVLKSVNDARRQTAILLELEAAAAAHASVAQASLATATTATAAATSVLLAPVTLAVSAFAAIGVAAVLVRNHNKALEESFKDLAKEAEAASARQVAAMNRVAAVAQSVSSYRLGIINPDDTTAIKNQIGVLDQYRAALDRQAKTVTTNGTPEGDRAAYEKLLSISQQRQEIDQQQARAQDMIVSAKERELAVSKSILDQALATKNAEEARSQSENIRLGLLSQADKRRAKALQDKEARGEEFSLRDAQQAQRLGVSRKSVEQAALREAEKAGLSQRQEEQNQPLQQARQNFRAAENTAGLAIPEIQKEIETARKRQEQYHKTVVAGLQLIGSQQAQIDELKAVIERNKLKQKV